MYMYKKIIVYKTIYRCIHNIYFTYVLNWDIECMRLLLFRYYYLDYILTINQE